MTGSWRFHRTTPADMMQEGARIAYIRDLNSGEILSTALGTITPDNTLLITQACTNVYYKGRGFIGYVADELRLSFFADPPVGSPQITDAELYVRQLQSNPNRAPVRAYEKVDFVGKEIRRFDIERNFKDHHLLQSSDPDGKYSCLWMVADGSSLKNCFQRTAMFKAEYS